MGKKHVTVNIEGYGRIKVRRPAPLDEDSFADAVGDAVAKTMQLLHPRSQQARFHPATGFGGYQSPI